MLERWETGESLRRRNRVVGALGHGRLRTARGDWLDIGGSVGGGSRRIIDSWKPPDWREWLESPDEECDF